MGVEHVNGKGISESKNIMNKVESKEGNDR